jgi:hypothetical protein
VIRPVASRCRHRTTQTGETQTDIHASSRANVPSVWMVEDISCLRPLGQWAAGFTLCIGVLLWKNGFLTWNLVMISHHKICVPKIVSL